MGITDLTASFCGPRHNSNFDSNCYDVKILQKLTIFNYFRFLKALMLSRFIKDFVLFMNWKVASHSYGRCPCCGCCCCFCCCCCCCCFPFFLIQSYSSENFVKTETRSIVGSEYEIRFSFPTNVRCQSSDLKQTEMFVLSFQFTDFQKYFYNGIVR